MWTESTIAKSNETSENCIEWGNIQKYLIAFLNKKKSTNLKFWYIWIYFQPTQF